MLSKALRVPEWLSNEDECSCPFLGHYNACSGQCIFWCGLKDTDGSHFKSECLIRLGVLQYIGYDPTTEERREK